MKLYMCTMHVTEIKKSEVYALVTSGIDIGSRISK